MSHNASFTPQAAARWNELDAQLRERIVNNVYCVSCGSETMIVAFAGHIEAGDLILQGSCARCGGSVARLIESE